MRALILYSAVLVALSAGAQGARRLGGPHRLPLQRRVGSPFTGGPQQPFDEYLRAQGVGFDSLFDGRQRPEPAESRQAGVTPRRRRPVVELRPAPPAPELQDTQEPAEARLAPRRSYVPEQYQEPLPVEPEYNPQRRQSYGPPVYSDPEPAADSPNAYSLDIPKKEDKKRLEFQVHGQEGPHTYRFGYDTGLGYNRQFRFEERDNKGNVKGRYGFYDKYGKLQVVNYSATPDGGFHAEGDFGKYPNASR